MKICPACGVPCLEANRHCPACGHDISGVEATDGDPYLGFTIAGKYRLEQLLGQGVMGRVYRARHLALESDVAVKLVNPESAADPGTAARFQQEARASSRLRHPNSVAVLDFGQTETGLLYLVTEMLRGRTLATILRDEAPLDPRRIVDLLAQGLAALDAAHAAGVVHRDFKLDNLFVEPLRSSGEHVKVLDFGIAKLRGEDDPGLTADGSVCGTPDYMSPEQVRGDELDGRSDIYAAGVVLYELLTGTRPYTGTLLEVLRRHMGSPPEPPKLRRPDLPIPVPLEAICLKALAKRRDERYPTAEEMRQALISALAHDPLRCKECGSARPAGALFCPSCGSTVEDSLDAPTAATVTALAQPYVGRDQELRELTGLERGALLILGAPGAGRSRLVEEWRKRVTDKMVLLRPDPSGAMEPWRPVRRALAQVLGIPEERATRLEVEAATLHRPHDRVGLLEVFGLGGPAGVAEQPLRRREATAAAAGMLREARATIVCEDADRYDRRSSEVVARLLADPGSSRVVVTARTRGDLGAAPTITLGPLAPAALAALKASPEQVGPTDGTPLTVEQVLRARAEGAADRTAGARIAMLPVVARRVLAALAVGGGETDLALLGEVLALADPGTPAQLLARRGFVRIDGQKVEIPSPTLRDQIYEAVSPEERRSLHLAWRGALAARQRSPVVLAHHEWSADPHAAAVELLERAATQAERAGDAPGVVRWRGRALERAREVGEPADRMRLALGFGEALAQVGDVQRAEAAFREALAAGASDLRGEALARRGLGRLEVLRNHLELARMELRRGLEKALAGNEPGLIADLALELGDVLGRMARPRDASQALAAALDHVGGRPEFAWRVELAQAERALADGSAADAERHGRAALGYADQVSPAAAARVRELLASLCRASGDVAGAATHRRAAVEALDRVGDRRGAAELLLTAALEDTRDVGAARRWVAQAGELARQVGWRDGVQRAREALRRLE